MMKNKLKNISILVGLVSVFLFAQAATDNASAAAQNEDNKIVAGAAMNAQLFPDHEDSLDDRNALTVESLNANTNPRKLFDTNAYRPNELSGSPSITPSSY